MSEKIKLEISNMRDWRIEEGLTSKDDADLHPGDERLFQATVEYNGASQLFVMIAPVGEGAGAGADNSPQIGISIEINNGVPCVHLSADALGDNLLHVFSPDGKRLVLNTEGETKYEPPSRLTYRNHGVIAVS
ncbi:hypothetical protein [Thioalkalivibrio thiocyanodenitrificans]|uniref:hypothetical protein n=1 Tax=Thioalkalivibrio thiocyanodenitrificans TaxID=243063 RepID=UPI00036B9B5E|nr:hypothetical protein [Thioalkalivibrio thiocyanodenitrificans]